MSAFRTVFHTVFRTVPAVLLIAALCTPASPALAEPVPVADPVPEKPIASPLTLTLEEFASFPRSEPIPPPSNDPRLVRHARINYLGELPDGSRRLYVNDLNGRLYLLGRDRQPQEYLDVAAAFAPDFVSGRGLGSGFGFTAFHPEFGRNGRFYTVHTEWGAALTTKTPDLPPQPGTRFHGVITEWTAADPRAGVFSGTRREVLRLGFSGQIHGIQQIDFNPGARPGDADYGLLYIAAGDGGRGASSDDPQNLAIPQGKLLRIDPAGTDGRKYGIPPANPFAGQEGRLGEIYAYGMRDPHRFSWDGDRILLGHIGEHAIEAVYDVGPGDNLGWSEREGSFVFDQADRCRLYTLPDDDARYGYTYPVAAYDHDPPPGHPCNADSGHAIVGGFVYRGDRLPLLSGTYLFGDIVDGQIFHATAAHLREGLGRAAIYQPRLVDAAGNAVTMRDLAGDTRVDLRFGRDARGELYVLSKANGRIWKVTRAAYAPAGVLPSLRRGLVAAYDFEHPLPGDPAREQDQGLSGTDLSLVNGGAAMRVEDGAYRGSAHALQTGQVEPATAGNDDWKAGVYAEPGVPTLRSFNAVAGATVMGWFKVRADGPAPDSNTADPADRYNAIGLAGVLTGTSQGHDVRALLELITVNGELKVVALARRVDGSASQTFAADLPWQRVLPRDQWVFLAATFDFDTGAMRLYRNGRPLDGSSTVAGDPWGVEGAPEPDLTSPTDPRGIKIGGSYPQNTREQNPCDCRMDGLLFLDRVAAPGEIRAQYELLRHR